MLRKNIAVIAVALSVSGCASMAENMMKKMAPELPAGVELKEVTCSNISLGGFGTDKCEEKMRENCPNGHVRHMTSKSGGGIGGFGKSEETISYYCK